MHIGPACCRGVSARLHGFLYGEFFMDDGKAFIDYYAVLQVDPQCSTKALALAYRRLAGNYHPDHPETADPQRFTDVIEAYRLLGKADRRSDYDALYARRT